MSKFLKKRSGAIVVLILVIVLSTVFSAHRSLKAERAEIESMLVTGVDGKGFGINGDIEKRVDYSRNLVKIARDYPDLDDECEAVADACDALTKRDGGASEAYTLNKQLSDTVENLYLSMSDLTLTEKDEQYRQELYANILSRNDTITNEAAKYNKLALEFNNDTLGTFPANILRLPAFIAECELFA